MTVKRIRRMFDSVDDYGDPVPGADDRKEIPGAFTAPRRSEGVDRDGRSGVIIGLTLFAPFGSDIVYSDQIDLDGVVWEIDGEPGAWEHPKTGWEAGMEIALVRGEG